MGTMIEFKRPDGGAVRGYLAEAEKAFGSVVASSTLTSLKSSEARWI